MKKTFNIFTAAFIAAAVLLSGCSDEADEPLDASGKYENTQNISDNTHGDVADDTSNGGEHSFS